MNTHKLIQQHERAIEMLEDIQYNEKLRISLSESINGIGGTNFPDMKREWQISLVRIESKLGELKVEYRKYMNNLK